MLYRLIYYAILFFHSLPCISPTRSFLILKRRRGCHWAIFSNPCSYTHLDSNVLNGHMPGRNQISFSLRNSLTISGVGERMSSLDLKDGHLGQGGWGQSTIFDICMGWAAMEKHLQITFLISCSRFRGNPLHWEELALPFLRSL